jgi:glutamate--cysteine ligase
MSAGSFEAGRDWLAADDNVRLVANGLRGLEKECLRVGRDGHLSDSPHSPRYGSALTHPWLTTDYSEALLEFVTPPLAHNESGLAFLDDLHAFVVQEQDADEFLWPASMPCIVAADESVPIAHYGSSNEGRLRSIYRSGLGYRYGRAMQAIAGTHFNYSLPAAFWPAYRDHRGSRQSLRDFKSESLMALARNYRRVGWLLVYLYGASPAFCKSFRPSGHARLESLDHSTWYAPHSTSLRMSDMGYRNSTQARLAVSLNSLDQYLDELETALTTPDPRYEAIGVVVDGEYRQLSANLLQLENEYYSSIRPKPARKEPRLIAALAGSGVEYVEIRTLDLNPFAPSGISLEQMRLVELLLLYCLISDSPPIGAQELDEIDSRELTVAWEGRRPGLGLPRDGGQAALADWAGDILEALDDLAALLDGGGQAYRAAVAAARAAVQDPALCLSAQLVDELVQGRCSFFEWACERAQALREHFAARDFAPARLDELRATAAESLEAAARLETADEPPFAEFLAAHLASGIGRKAGAARRIL